MHPVPPAPAASPDGDADASPDAAALTAAKPAAQPAALPSKSSTPVTPVTTATSPAIQGLCWGLLAAAIWASYSVLARLGVKAGLTAADLSLLRFAPGALLMAPLLFRWGWRDLAGVGWWRGAVLSLLAGLGFSLLFMTGFTLAPLAHGAVIAPACQMLSGLALSAWWLGQRPTRDSVMGAGVVVVGLAFMGGDALLHQAGAATALGDLLFACAGMCWGAFSVLSRRWRVDPLRVTAVVVVLSFLAFAPPYLALKGTGPLLAAGLPMLLLQALAQGVGAGLVAVLAFSRAAQLLGSGRAAFFGALVPGAASLLAIPVLGEVPAGLQVLGIAAVVVGLLVAFGGVSWLRARWRGRFE